MRRLAISRGAAASVADRATDLGEGMARFFPQNTVESRMGALHLAVATDASLDARAIREGAFGRRVRRALIA